ncbi:MAG: alpha/beta hydrolase, partial [Candidatus Methanomethylophilaceae archaeon]|nr:alpha/beta hydrolase [Candidatus Methanomethylophilaceae archaeon]
MNVDINGIGLNYEDTGSGEVLVLVSGFCSNLRYWKNMVPMLEGYRVVRLDNHGVGDTVYSGDFSIDDMADDVVALMDHLGVDRFSVLGW